MHVYHNCYKNKHFYFFSLIYKNERKNMNFDDKKLKKLDFTKIKKYLI